ncbi:MAG: hypothetical protein Kow0059_16890 [Candidatus Sumerlaeia bacterium]
MNARFPLALFIISTGISMIAGVLPGQSPPHNSANAIGCNDCHAFYSQLRRGEAQASLCLSCHNPTGRAAAMSDVANHVVNGGATVIDCGTCHDPHGPQLTTNPNTGVTTANLKLIRGNMKKYWSGALEPAVFHNRPGDFAFGESAGQWVAVCQTCHTQTAVHRQDSSSGHSHAVGADCMSCHPHSTGFLPVGGDCVSCHSVIQDNGDQVPPGGRRAVTAEFPAGSAHAHYGQSLDGTDCLVCHDIRTHGDGLVDLIDPDNEAILYSFEQPGRLENDPDVSTFCAHCHDADGAQRLADPMDPFGNGTAAPDVASRFLGTLQWNEWYGDFCFGTEGTLRAVNSHHDISDADQAFSGAKLECLNCHGAHSAAGEQPLVEPFDNPTTDTYSTTVWTASSDQFCLTCHGGGEGPSNPGFPSNVRGPSVALRGLDTCSYTSAPWHVDYTWTYSVHGPASKRPLTGYSGAPDADVPCLTCHDAHGSYTPSNPAGNPYMIRDYVDGTAFIDDGVRPGAQWTGPPWTTTGTARTVVVTVSGTTVDWGSETSLCQTCHANWLNAYDWHSFCTGCQTCHGHGQSWGEYDWVMPDESVPCPPPGAAAAMSGGEAPGLVTEPEGGIRTAPNVVDGVEVELPLHRAMIP